MGVKSLSERNVTLLQRTESRNLGSNFMDKSFEGKEVLMHSTQHKVLPELFQAGNSDSPDRWPAFHR